MKRLILTGIVGTLLFATPVFSAEDARGMYVEQLQKPKATLNTGVSYWLELNRKGKRSRVSNRTTFHSGDKVRFHVKPNFNGFAYILMMQSSQGDHSVLFPSKKFPANRLTAGREVSLPVGNDGAEAWLKFDSESGNEVLRVLASRKKIDPKSQFAKEDDETVVIASSESDDKVPDGTVISVDTRNLSVVEEKKKPLHGGVTVVRHNPAKMLSIDITLKHED